MWLRHRFWLAYGQRLYEILSHVYDQIQNHKAIRCEAGLTCMENGIMADSGDIVRGLRRL
jgi:hypothetical protein